MTVREALNIVFQHNEAHWEHKGAAELHRAATTLCEVLIGLRSDLASVGDMIVALEKVAGQQNEWIGALTGVMDEGVARV